jgi:hypothetical protein
MTLIDTRKTLILPLILMGLMIGATGAWWTAKLKVTGTITTDNFLPQLSLPDGGWGDNEVTKDIGHVTAGINVPLTEINVSIDHAYPGYEAWVSIGIHNRGSVPCNISAISWVGAPPELKIWISPSPSYAWPVIGHILDYCHEIFFILHVRVYENDTAIPPILPLQDHTYKFNVTITCTQYNMP